MFDKMLKIPSVIHQLLFTVSTPASLMKLQLDGEWSPSLINGPDK